VYKISAQNLLFRDVLVNETIISIIGASSFAKEVFSHIYSDLEKKDLNKTIINFYVDDKYINNNNNKVFNKYDILPISKLDSYNSKIIVAIGDSLSRYNLVKRLNLKDSDYLTIIHSSGKILFEESISIGIGSIICANCILTCDINIGKHVHLNLNTTVGHDTTIGNFFTSAPGVNISGNVKIGDRVYMGTNSSIKNNVSVCDDVVIGMGACVTKDITVSGTYVGIPVKKV
jgi:sugar O-acyltransferase (sialic acid O-acetyltransferase NeuD family)